MPESQRSVGNSTVVDSGAVVLGDDDDSFTIAVQGLNFTVRIVNEPRADRLRPERISNDKMLIKINTWSGGDLTFKFKVGTLNNRELYLAIHADIYNNNRVITYTFSMPRS
jgi:hypothetical protein